MEKLKDFRKEKKLTQIEMANILNVTQVTYSGYENGKYEPNIDTLIKMADYFNVSVDTLVGHEKKSNELSSITLTENQKLVINQVLKLDDLNLKLAFVYCKGLYDAQIA